MKRKGRQVYIAEHVWKLVEEASEKDQRSVNRWLEILLTSHFLKQAINDKK